jgi:hypothetical protein
MYRPHGKFDGEWRDCMIVEKLPRREKSALCASDRATAGVGCLALPMVALPKKAALLTPGHHDR